MHKQYTKHIASLLLVIRSIKPPKTNMNAPSNNAIVIAKISDTEAKLDIVNVTSAIRYGYALSPQNRYNLRVLIYLHSKLSGIRVITTKHMKDHDILEILHHLREAIGVTYPISNKTHSIGGVFLKHYLICFICILSFICFSGWFSFWPAIFYTYIYALIAGVLLLLGYEVTERVSFKLFKTKKNMQKSRT